ncbi:hypothetical protein GS399_10060 [Pedobacter sp. HMF7647]|uniref:Asl1-like glycosyl hydrolase catalytic domain-containing protein n=1 Tax=Hufsiella arboris TaxID=2695275 RepID=A0A7K1Y9Q9_9SPHI|nr:glycosyl hydrolase [Hufsiella arboris]MXV51312.1 hypothetical protein [Hufsiella arboris]
MLKHTYLRKTFLSILAIGLFTVSCKKDADLESQNGLVSANGVALNKSDALMATSVPLSPLLSGSSLELGINGHPLDGTGPYSHVSASKQIEMLQKMGMNWYRADVTTMSDGRITVPYLFDPLMAAATSGGVKILPALKTRTLDLNATQSASYSAGKKLGADFAAKYGKYFTYYNLGNELELKLLLPGRSGQSQLHYDRTKFNVTAAYLKGMDEGIKSQDPDAKTMIDASWLHYGYLRMLEWYGVKFDIIAYHWYSEMESLGGNKTYNIPDITLKLSSLFTKPIWFTEVNSRYKADDADFEVKQDAFIKKFIQKCKNNPQVKVLIFYELFDEPQKNSTLEKNYGLNKWTTKYTSWTKKMIAQSLTVK